MGPIARGRLSRRARTRSGAQDGFTLIELLIAMVILTIVMASLTSVLVSASHTELDVNRRFRRSRTIAPASTRSGARSTARAP